MSICYLCGCTLEDHANDKTANHFEQVIPQAIGGQLMVKDILCKTCGGDKHLGGNIDKPFSDMFRLITDRIDMKRDRKTRPVPLKGKLKILDNDSVFDVHLREDVLSTERPEYRVDHKKKKVLVFANKIIANNFKKKVENDLIKDGEIDSSYSMEVISNLTLNQEFFGVVEFPFNVDNKIFEAGFAKIAIEFALSKGIPFESLSHLVDQTSRTIKSEGTLLPYYPIFKPEEVIEYLRTSLDENFMSHSLVLFSQRQIQVDGVETKQLCCFVELFGTFQYFVRLNNHYTGEDIEPTTYSQKIIHDPGTHVNMSELSPKDLSIYMLELGISFTDIKDKTDAEARKMIQTRYDSRNRYVFDYAKNTKRIVDRLLMDSILNSKKVIIGMTPDIVYHFYRNPDTDDFHIQFFRSRYFHSGYKGYLSGEMPSSIIPEIVELYETVRERFKAYTFLKFREIERFVNENNAFRTSER